MSTGLLVFIYFLIGVGLFALSGIVWFLLIGVILLIEYKLGLWK